MGGFNSKRKPELEAGAFCAAHTMTSWLIMTRKTTVFGTTVGAILQTELINLQVQNLMQ
jgi:hypothetical protein